MDVKIFIEKIQIFISKGICSPPPPTHTQRVVGMCFIYPDKVIYLYVNVPVFQFSGTKTVLTSTRVSGYNDDLLISIGYIYIYYIFVIEKHLLVRPIIRF